MATQAVKAGSKAAGVVIDDAAVTPRYVTGFSAERELPIIRQIALGSLRNKFFILLPLALLLSSLAPFLITPLLMLGGSYLCFEGAEKVWHHFFVGKQHAEEHTPQTGDPAHLERERVAGAIKTDFILSAEIMTIALAEIPDRGFVIEAITLAIVGAAITGLVYGGVALIVKADDVGLHLHETGSLHATRIFGRGIVHAMPGFLVWLSAIGTAAMLWVGGSIIVHGLEDLGAGALAHGIHHAADTVRAALPWGAGFMAWLARATLDGLFGLALGLLLVLPGERLIAPLWARLTRKR